MNEIVLKVDGMMCSMCEAHMNDAIRRAFSVKKVTSSHKKGETVIVTDAELADEELQKVVAEMGYKVLEIRRGAYEKKGFFSRFRK